MPQLRGFYPPLANGRRENIDSVLYNVIPAKAGIQRFQGFTNWLDPGFHRGDGWNLIFPHLRGARGDFWNLLPFCPNFIRKRLNVPASLFMRIFGGHCHTYPVHIAIKSCLAIFTFELNGTMRNSIPFHQKLIDLLEDWPGSADLDVAHQDMSAQGMDTGRNGP